MEKKQEQKDVGLPLDSLNMGSTLSINQEAYIAGAINEKLLINMYRNNFERLPSYELIRPYILRIYELGYRAGIASDRNNNE